MDGDWWGVKIRDVLDEGRGVGRPAPAQGPRERSTALGEVEAAGIGVHGGAPARQPAAGVGDDGPVTVSLGRDHSQQNRPAVPLTTAHTGPYRLRTGAVTVRGLPGRCTGLRQSSASGPPPLPGDLLRRARDAGTGAHDPGTTSGRMSIRQPVSFAARRAFCPSLPMASESW